MCLASRDVCNRTPRTRYITFSPGFSSFVFYSNQVLTLKDTAPKHNEVPTLFSSRNFYANREDLQLALGALCYSFYINCKELRLAIGNLSHDIRVNEKQLQLIYKSTLLALKSTQLCVFQGSMLHVFSFI